jgi:hypothetical protein
MFFSIARFLLIRHVLCHGRLYTIANINDPIQRRSGPSIGECGGLVKRQRLGVVGQFEIEKVNIVCGEGMKDFYDLKGQAF